MSRRSFRAEVLAAALLAGAGCDRSTDMTEPPAPVREAHLRLSGSPGPVGFSGEIVLYQSGLPPLAATLEGNTSDPPEATRLMENLQRIHLELVKTQESGTLVAEILVEGTVVARGETSEPFGFIDLDVDLTVPTVRRVDRP